MVYFKKVAFEHLKRIVMNLLVVYNFLVFVNQSKERKERERENSNHLHLFKPNYVKYNAFFWLFFFLLSEMVKFQDSRFRRCVLVCFVTQVFKIFVLCMYFISSEFVVAEILLTYLSGLSGVGKKKKSTWINWTHQGPHKMTKHDCQHCPTQHIIIVIAELQ